VTIERLRELEAAATPGPWAWRSRSIDGPTGRWIAYLPTEGEGLTDVELIAATRNALPALLDVAEAARQLIDAGCWGHAGHSECCFAGRLSAVLAALDKQA
jgi:hypothetical protein